MKPFRPLSVAEQLAAHLREEILRGTLNDTMPGVHQLRETLGTSPQTVVEALKILGHQGLLVSQGPGRRSRIVIPENIRPPGLRVEIMLYEKADVTEDYIIELKHQLMEAGHSPRFSRKCLLELGMDVKRVVRHVEKTEADAWVVMAGSQPILDWFATHCPVPTLALFGRIRDVQQLAGVMPDKNNALTTVVRKLVALGHRRVVLIVRAERRLPQPGAFEQMFLNLLVEQGIKTGPYNLPDWEENPAGLCRCLDSLHGLTPPTALILDEAALFMTARLHLAQRGIMVPRDVSMVCLDSNPAFEWSCPAVSHVGWDSGAVVRRILQWADNIARGREDSRKTFLKATFIEGETIGPAPLT